VSIFRKGSPADFSKPIELPEGEEQRDRWQAANRSWWESNPMRYDWRDGELGEEFTPDFYREIDRRFFENVRDYMPWTKLPFDPLIDFELLASQDVLEIGVGNGSHAQLIAESARSYTGIDLTEYAVSSTTKRLECFGIDATIRQMDAEHLEFPDDSFDFVWSWGVVHHSANTPQIISEISRVLRPGGRCVTMVYHRSLWFYYFIRSLIPGILGGRFFKGQSIAEVAQSCTDGAIARYYTAREWKEMVSPYLEVEQTRIYGQKNELIPLPACGLKTMIENMLPAALGRFVTNTLRQGSFLVVAHRKAS
jgi:SAM-dependent methyltransferase